MALSKVQIETVMTSSEPNSGNFASQIGSCEFVFRFLCGGFFCGLIVVVFFFFVSVWVLLNSLRFWAEGVKDLSENLCHVISRRQLCEQTSVVGMFLWESINLNTFSKAEDFKDFFFFFIGSV